MDEANRANVDLFIDQNTHNAITLQLNRHNKLYKWNAPIDTSNILDTTLLPNFQVDKFTRSLTERNSSSNYGKIYLSLVSRKGLKDFNSHNKWITPGFLYSKEDIINACKQICKSKLSGRIQLTLLRHVHVVYMDPAM